jgi:hypothetical protein
MVLLNGMEVHCRMKPVEAASYVVVEVEGCGVRRLQLELAYIIA